MRLGIFTQIWIPLSLITIVAVGALILYYPQRQEMLIARYKQNELSLLGSTVAIEVSHALNQDDFSGLQSMMAFLSEGRDIDFSALVFEDSTGREELAIVQPEKYPLKLNELDTTHTIFARAPFKSKSIKGYILIGLNKEKFSEELTNLNKPILIIFIGLVVIVVLFVLVLARRISTPIEGVTAMARRLQQGDFNIEKQETNASAHEIQSLQRSLNDLASTLKQQKEANDHLTQNLEEQVRLKTNNLQLAFNDLSAAQEIAYFANFSYDTATDQWKGSANLANVLGLKEKTPPLFQPLLQYIHTDDLPLLQNKLRLAIKSTGKFNQEVRWKRPDNNEEIWLDCNGYCYLGAKGKAVFRGVVQGITQRKKQQEELKILSDVARRTSNLVIITDKNRRIQWVNESVVTTSGYSMEELIGQTPKIFQSEKSDKKELEKLNTAIKNGESTWAEIINISKDGKEYWININIVPIHTEKGELNGFMAVEIDTTERKQLEIQREETIRLLEESRKEIEYINRDLEAKVEEKTRSVRSLALFPQQNPNPILEVDYSHKKITYFNSAAQRMIPTLLESTVEDLFQMLQIDTTVLQAGQGIKEIAIGDFVFEANFFRLEEDDLVRIYLHNISERKENEVKLAAAIEKLQQTEGDLKQKTAQLENSLLELERTQNDLINKERLSTLGVLIAGIAHEINTPLGAIKASGENLRALFNNGLIELIPKITPSDLATAMKLFDEASFINISTVEERKLVQDLSAKIASLGIETRKAQKHARTFVQMGIHQINDQFKDVLTNDGAEIILQLALNLVLIFKSIQTTTISADQGSKVVRALNTFAHGNLASTVSEFNLYENIETVITIFWNKIKQGSKVELNIPKDVLLFGLAEEMTQVWTNLVNNALHASGNSCTIRFDYKEIDMNQVIEVSNNGPQIPNSIINRIFDPFFTTKSRGEGTGLGLNIVQGIIEKHKGTIRCESDERSTKFIITLPLNDNRQ